MELFLKLDVNIFSIVLLVIFYIIIRLRNKVMGTSIRLFLSLLLGVAWLLILEILSWKYDGVQGMNELNYFFNFVFALFTSMMTCLLASYIDYHILGSYENLKKRWFYIHPFIITSVLLVVNFFEPIIFSVSADNVYRREAFMILLPMINIIMFMYICYHTYLNRKKIKKEVIYVLLLYIFIPAIVAFLQVEIFGIFILWPVMSMMLIITYIYLETVSTSQDYLTGLVSRHRVDSYLEYMLQQKNNFILAMIDLNGFKKINDTYGHLKGDEALKVFSKSLKHNFIGEKVIGRYGGDEFILILDKVTIENTEERFNSIREDMDSLYESGEIDFRISFSYGCYDYKGTEDMSYETIVSIADKKMYMNKIEML